jgi:hypothetical protein
VGVARAPGRIGNDPGLSGPPQVGVSERIYAGLLRAYPRTFRTRYEDEMVVLFGDQLRDARAARGVGGTTVTWFRTLLDLVSSAIGEHLRGDRTMAQSLATFEPTRSMRLLGLVGIIGGLLLLWAWVGNPFDIPVFNVVRLVVFSLGGAAVSLALYPRLAAGRPRVAAIVVGAVVFTSIWQTVWILLSANMLHPFGGTYGLIGFVASHLAWLSAAGFGAAVLWIPTAWEGMGRRSTAATRLAGLALAIGSIVTNVGDDRLELVTSATYGAIWSTIALTGLFLNGAGWVVLGAILVLGGRRRPGGGETRAS